MLFSLGIEDIRAVRFWAVLQVRNLTMDQLEELSGVSRRTLFRITQDPDYNPQKDTWGRISAALRCEEPWLISGEGVPFATAAGRLALAMTVRGMTPETLHATIKKRVSIDRIVALLAERIQPDPVEITVYAIALKVEARWILYGTARADRQTPEIKDLRLFSEAMRKALRDGGTEGQIITKTARFYNESLHSQGDP